MPTVLRQDGFEVMIFTHDHPPAHVHVFKAGGEAIINLGDEKTRPWTRENNRMSQKDEKRALAIVSAHQNMLLREWRNIHGDS
jgi:hypothetical protein